MHLQNYGLSKVERRQEVLTGRGVQERPMPGCEACRKHPASFCVEWLQGISVFLCTICIGHYKINRSENRSLV